MENITQEEIEMARKAKSKEELISYAKEEGYELSDEEANRIFEYLHKQGELDENELSDVTGGWCKNGGSTPKYAVNQTVYVCDRSMICKAHVTYVSPTKKKYGAIFKDETWAYNIEYDESPFTGKKREGLPEYELYATSSLKH